MRGYQCKDVLCCVCLIMEWNGYEERRYDCIMFVCFVIG